MFRSLVIIIRELYLYLSKVIFMLKHSEKLCRYVYLMWQHVVERHVCCVQCRMRHYIYIVYFNVNLKLLTKLINSAFVGM